MAKNYLIDTSAVIKYLNGTLPDSSLKLLDQIIDQKTNISFISEIELQVWNPPDERDVLIYTTFVR